MTKYEILWDFCSFRIRMIVFTRIFVHKHPEIKLRIKLCVSIMSNGNFFVSVSIA
jgi:hypothetical protein